MGIINFWHFQRILPRQIFLTILTLSELVLKPLNFYFIDRNASTISLTVFSISSSFTSHVNPPILLLLFFLTVPHLALGNHTPCRPRNSPSTPSPLSTSFVLSLLFLPPPPPSLFTRKVFFFRIDARRTHRTTTSHTVACSIVQLFFPLPPYLTLLIWNT